MELDEYVNAYVRGFIADKVLPAAKRGDAVLSRAVIPQDIISPIRLYSDGVRCNKEPQDLLRGKFIELGYRVTSMTTMQFCSDVTIEEMRAHPLYDQWILSLEW